MRAHKRANKLLKKAEDTLSLSTPVTDPKVTPLLGDKATRKDIWNALLGKERANTIIDSSQKFRKKHPEYFNGVFYGDNINRPINAKIRSLQEYMSRYGPPKNWFHKLGIKTLAKQQSGLYQAPSINRQGKREADQIWVKKNDNLRVLLHEFLHPDTYGMRPQAWNKALDDFKKGKHQTIINQRSKLREHTPEHSVGKNTQYITDKVYPGTNKKQTHEIGSQIGTLRAHLEQQGVDTTKPNAIRNALNNLDKYIKGNDEIQKFHDVIQDNSQKGIIDRTQDKIKGILQYFQKDIQKDPARKNNYIESIIKIMQGITQRKPNSNNYPV